MLNFRLVVAKKQPFQIKKQQIQTQINSFLQLDVCLSQHLIIYDIFNCTIDEFEQLKSQVLVDSVTDEIIELDFSTVHYFAIELLPGQFDVRANAAIQSLQLLHHSKEITITTAEAFVFNQELTKDNRNQLIHYFCNPVEKQLKDLTKPLSLAQAKLPKPVEEIANFIHFTSEEIKQYREQEGLAMSEEDILFIQDYFKNEEKRNPTETEIKVLDTYWSDHCRHTTFFTEINQVSFENGVIAQRAEQAYQNYLSIRKRVYQEREKPISLMDLATLAAKNLKQRGILTSVEESDEINACSMFTKVMIDGKEEDWLLMFKNETHNHPTEIEPFGGASTCLGGCIRDPLSGRAYVYQAMRVSGAANPLQPVQETLAGKLPQVKICKEAADGFASYGNEIGLATTHVAEIYHPGYQAKRMEVGAVVAAAPVQNIRRDKPVAGDLIVLLGGKTGRDGVGGATGSSKEHNEESLETAGAEVQKGNPPEERKIQRLFRNGDVTRLIKKCNDFGAGGVSVAIGELADGLDINLDTIPTKYTGLNGTELALAESQERMAVVIDAKDLEQFQALADEENLESTVVAIVTSTNRLRITWKGQTIVDISRAFIDTNGVSQQAEVLISEPQNDNPLLHSNAIDELPNILRQLNIASQQGLVEQFDSNVGATTVLMPFGGKYQQTPTQVSAQLFPVRDGETTTVSVMSYGFDPELSKWSPFHGGAFAVVDSVAKLIATGVHPNNIYFTFQEYFRKLGKNPENWGLPFASLLGAFEAQQAFQSGAIGGKDSMSGTFQDIHVPPTLISFAVGTLDAQTVISNELKSTESTIYLLKHDFLDDFSPNFDQLNENFKQLQQANQEGKIRTAQAVQQGVLPALVQMAAGNRIGFELNTSIDLFQISIGSILIESEDNLGDEFIPIGKTTDKKQVVVNEHSFELESLIDSWTSTFESIYPTQSKPLDLPLTFSSSTQKQIQTKAKPAFRVVKPNVFIPVFPGTNCEYDAEKAFSRAGAETKQFVFRNRSEKDIQESILAFERHIQNSQILMLSGGFSAGDEPDGSGKFIAAILKNNRIQEAIDDLLYHRDGLILGICNGFQALVRSGLLPFGDMKPTTALAKNEIGRHISQIVETKIVSNNSPWLANYQVGDTHHIAISHGEGRFFVEEQVAKQLFDNGQVATQYIDFDGNPTMERPYNPNGSMYAIEGVLSPDGKIFGKMGHSERMGPGLYQNIPFEVGQDIFRNGVEYFLD